MEHHHFFPKTHTTKKHLDLQTSNLFLVAAVVAHFCSESTTKSGSLPKRLFLNVFGRTGINTHQFVEFVILWPQNALIQQKKTLDPSVGFNNSLIDVSIVFGFRRFVSKRGDDRKHLKRCCKS